MPVSNRLTLSLLGRFAANKGGYQVLETQTASWNLLAYLSLSADMSEVRTKLATFLWETSDELRGRRNLRQLMYRMRNELGANWPGIEADRETIRLNPKYVKTDIGEIFQVLRSGHVPEIIIDTKQIQNRLLDHKNYYGDLSSSWVHMSRREFETRLQTALEPILYGNDETEKMRAARALLSLDPVDETAACKLIEIYWSKGGVGRALRVYAALWDHLDQEFDMEPGMVAQNLIARVKTEEPPEHASPALNNPVQGNLKADIVVKKSNVDGLSPESAAIANLFRAETISNLLKFRQFSVIDATVQDEVAQYQLETTFGQSGKTLRMSATLVKRATGVVIWSENIENVQAGWWSHQTALAGHLASACATSVSATRLAEIESKSLAQDAFDNWLLGQSLINEFRLENLDRVEQCFAECIRLAPKSPFGYSALSQLYNGRHLRGPQEPPSTEAFSKSKELATKAMSLDPLDTRAHLCRAWASCLLREFDQADAGFSMAFDCNRFDHWIVISAALGHAFCDNQKSAKELLSYFEDRRWFPTLQHWGYIAPARFVMKDFNGCIDAANQAGDVIQNVKGWKAAALWQMGHKDQARAVWADFATHIAKKHERSGLKQWFLSSFPIRSTQVRQLLEHSITGLAG